MAADDEDLDRQLLSQCGLLHIDDKWEEKGVSDMSVELGVAQDDDYDLDLQAGLQADASSSSEDVPELDM